MIKNILSSLSICFSMYSVIPTPQVDWDKANMRYVFCFFPLVGVIIGGLQYLWFLLANALSLNAFLYASIAAVIPVLLSGGIHVDGFIDTCDAFFSFGDKEKRLQILKDPHVGAFGIIYCIVYFLLTLGLYSQLFTTTIPIFILALIYPLSRSFGGLVAINMRSARSSGLQHLFSESSVKKAVTVVLLAWAVLLTVLFLDISLIITGIVALAILLLFLWFRHFSSKTFGGITGDLVGFFICLFELFVLICCVFGGVLH